MAAKLESWRMFLTIFATKNIYITHIKDFIHSSEHYYNVTEYQEIYRMLNSPLFYFLTISEESATYITENGEYLRLFRQWTRLHVRTTRWFIFEFLRNSLTQTKQTKQKFIKLYYLDKIHFVELLFCSSDCIIWIQQSKKYNLMNICFVCFVWFVLVNEFPKKSIHTKLSQSFTFNFIFLLWWVCCNMYWHERLMLHFFTQRGEGSLFWNTFENVHHNIWPTCIHIEQWKCGWWNEVISGIDAHGN